MMEKEERLHLLQISTRLIEWVGEVKLDTGQKREFIRIMHDLGKQISWEAELKSDSCSGGLDMVYNHIT